MALVVAHVGDNNQNVTNNGTTVTFTNQAIGTAASNRLVFVGVSDVDLSGIGNNNPTCTIGGVTATQVGYIADSSSSLNHDAFWYWALVPTGTTATIILNYSGSTGDLQNQWVGIAVYNVTGASTTSPIATTATNSAGSGHATTSASITIASGNELIAFADQVSGASLSFTSWTNATAVTNQIYNTGTKIGTASATSTTAGAPAVTATWSSSSASKGPLLSMIVIAPAPVGDTLTNQILLFM